MTKWGGSSALHSFHKHRHPQTDPFLAASTLIFAEEPQLAGREGVLQLLQCCHP